MDFDNKLINEIREKYASEYVNVNNKEYISAEVFSKVLIESVIYESILGAHIQKNGAIRLSDDEILDFITNKLSDTNVVYNDNEYTVDLKY